jgi:CheY-like chemotaxis protein
LVEDNELNSEMMIRRLTRLGFKVCLAMDGASALQHARLTTPDLILLDMSLPEMDGWEVARRLKSDQTTKRIPIIALTAHAMTGDRERCLAAGCDEFESKPVNMASLTGKIARLAEQNGAPDHQAVGRPDVKDR